MGDLQVQTVFRHENQGDAQLFNLPGQMQLFMHSETASKVKWLSLSPETVCDSFVDCL